ncbi:MAG: hypothetical protein ACREI7_11330 [Myxococcota bacterium]
MLSRIARIIAILVLLTAGTAMPATATGPDTLLWQQPVSGGRADAGWSGFRFWAAGEGFSVGRRSAGYGVQGGAALPLAGRIGLTAGYRLTGFSLGDRLGAQLDDVAARSLAPILGIDVEF